MPHYSFVFIIWGVCFRSADNPVGLDSRVLIRFGYGLLRDKLSASVCDRIVQAVSSMIRFRSPPHLALPTKEISRLRT